MIGAALSAFQKRTASWQMMFAIGVGGLGVAAYKGLWSHPAPTYQPPPAPAPAPAAAPAAAPPAAVPQIVPTSKPVSAVVRPVTPASSFAPSRIAPAQLPPELGGLTRPPADPPPFEPPIGVQPGYVVPRGPQPRDVR